MAPVRRSKNLNKFYSKDSEDSPIKNRGKGDKSKQQKRNESDMLGSQWSKEELTRFYETYRKYGKNWKKVAGIVRRRFVETEALYDLNKPYLSLPDGIASVVGFIEMMNEYYNPLDSDESEIESDKELKISQKAQKRDQGKSRVDVSKSSGGHVPHMLRSKAVASSNGCVSLLKNMCSSAGVPLTVGKRTPRFRALHPYKQGDAGKYLSSSKQDLNSEDVIADELAQRAFAPAKVLKRKASSRISNRNAELERLTAVRDCGKIHTEAEMAGDKPIGSVKGDCLKGNLGIRKARNGESIRDSHNTVEISRKRKLFHEKTPSLQDMSSDPSSVKEAHQTNKRSRQSLSLSENESSALAALVALQDGKPMLESSPESGPKKNCGNHIMAGEDLSLNVGGILEAKQLVNKSTSRMKKIKRNSLSSKIPEAELPMNSLLGKQQKTEIPKADSVVDRLFSEQQKTAEKSVGPQVSASSRGDLLRQGNHLALPLVQVPSVNQGSLPTKVRSKRKMHPQKTLVQNITKSTENIRNGQSNGYSSSLLDRAHTFKEKLSHCLSSQTLQRWCAFEWFYSAIDYPWYAKREFVEYLNHVGLGHVPKLTRAEWGVIRSSLGKPRRLSQQFLREEKDKLEQYRESVRTHYSRSMEAIPSDLARPLRVGQRVIARHPKTRGMYDGSILTVEHNKYRVQFDRLELGVELVMDIDCMPLNMVDNLPEALRKQNISVPDGQMNFDGSIYAKRAGHTRCVPSKNMEDSNGPSHISSPAHPLKSSLRLENQDHPSCSWLKSASRSSRPTESPSYIDHSAIPAQESGSKVLEAVEVSGCKARKMVDVAVQAMSSLKEGEDSYTKIGKAIDNSNSLDFAEDSRIPAMRSMNHSNPSHCDLPCQNQATSCMAEQRMTDQTTDLKLDTGSDVMKLQIPSALISSCVATLLMIQTCTERQYPPAEAVEILDSALISLQPICPQNVPIYRDLQMCMGMVKNQILALIPT